MDDISGVAANDRWPGGSGNERRLVDDVMASNDADDDGDSDIDKDADNG